MKTTKLVFSILFLKGREGITIEELSKLVKVTKNLIYESIDELKIELNKHWLPLDIQTHNNNVTLVLSKEINNDLLKRLEIIRDIKLSKSNMEILTILAYKQPTTKTIVEKIRGTNCDYSFRKLLDLELIKEVGKAKARGNPYLYETTSKFLQVFDIKSLADLPKLDYDFEKQKEVSYVEDKTLFD